MFPTILIIDDEPSILQSLEGLLSDDGFEVITATNGYEGLKIIEEESPDLVLLDIWMPGIDGIETLKEIKKDNPFIPVIIITGHGNIEMAVKATKLGAFNLIEKPLSIDKLIVDINNALNFRRLEEENRFLRKKTIEKHYINGNSPAICELKKQIGLVARTSSSVLIMGENGTGKELAARTIHHLSQRAEQPLIDINCAVIPEERLESELFGHTKGAVDWSDTRKRGSFEMANQGTLFLDEVGDLSLRSQAKLVRVLEEQKFQRVGGSRTIKVDVRIIAATNKDLEKEIREGNFRKDLYYRLNEIPIFVPPLRERKKDIEILANFFLDEFAKKSGQKPKKMSKQALEMLVDYPWPGNVRELKNLMGRMMLMLDSDKIEASHMPPPYNPGAGKECYPENMLFIEDNLEIAKERFEKEFIRRKLSQSGNDPKKAARLIGLDSKKLLKKMKKLGL